MMVSASRRRSARIDGRRYRVSNVGLTGEALLALMRRGAEFGGLADAGDLFFRQVAADGCQQLF